MPKRGLCHVVINVPDYERALNYYDRMFGWLGYCSFSTLGIEHTGTYCIALPHGAGGVILRVKIPRLFAGSKSPAPETLLSYHIVLSDQGLSAAS